jgi:phosphate-selective porin OprO/OprP
VKKKFVVAGLLATALVSQGAQAKTLEDVLKEKGVITEEDFKTVTKSRPLDYKLGKGFTFNSPDQKFSLSLGARFQGRYTFTDKDDANGSVQDVSELRVRRMKVFMSGHAFSKDLTYKLQVNFADAATGSNGTSKLLEDALMNYKFLNEAQVQVGQDKVPFARQELTSSGAQQFVDRSNATDTFKPARDTGVMFHGKAMDSLLAYNLGWYGGVGQNVLRSNNNNALAARVAVNPFGDMPYSEADLDHSEKPLVSVGANYFMDTLKATRTAAVADDPATVANESKAASTALETNNLSFAGSNGWLGRSANLNKFTTTEKIDVDALGFDAAFKWMGLSAQGEYFWGQATGQKSDTKVRAHGYYAQAGYFIIPKHLETAFRYSYVDPNRDVVNDLQTELQGAVSYYFSKHNLKLQGDVTSIHKQVSGKPATDDMQYRLQAQIIF